MGFTYVDEDSLTEGVRLALFDMVGADLLSTAMSAMVRWAPSSNSDQEGVVNSAALRKPMKPRQQAA